MPIRSIRDSNEHNARFRDHRRLGPAIPSGRFLSESILAARTICSSVRHARHSHRTRVRILEDSAINSLDERRQFTGHRHQFSMSALDRL